MSYEEREDRMSAFIDQVINPRPEEVEEQIKAIEIQITDYERRYEMSSSTLKLYLSKGSIKGTAEICSWLILLKRRAMLYKLTGEE